MTLMITRPPRTPGLLVRVTPSLRVPFLFHPLPSPPTMWLPSTLLHTRRAALRHPHPFVLTDHDAIRIRVPRLRVPFVMTYASLSAWVYR